MSNILVSDEQYRFMRVESREALQRFGIGSNPGFSDGNIISKLGVALGVENTNEAYDEFQEYAGEMFRDSLGEVIGLPIPTTCEEVVVGLKRLS